MQYLISLTLLKIASISVWEPISFFASFDSPPTLSRAVWWILLWNMPKTSQHDYAILSINMIHSTTSEVIDSISLNAINLSSFDTAWMEKCSHD